ncbi:DUF6234 family protein [Streptomyces sp. MMG1121]|uniref:DUF6234 family protein n=1 Tax=Streptomyces sp. MMG1121 TaxID=1415544 RepID=UPI0006AF1C11|nr:DUF6234 family protein [Streptomyces sp. MMG1121]KOV65545.1 membrane protein [Streptomyces sp. MMG1121]
MDLPVAPPAFDATDGPRHRDRADAGVDIAVGCGLAFLELTALAVIFGLWFLSGVTLDTAKTVKADPLWGCLTAAGAVGACALVAALAAARARAVVTVAGQGVMALLISAVVFAGAKAQAHDDATVRTHEHTCRTTPATPGCRG